MDRKWLLDLVWDIATVVMILTWIYTFLARLFWVRPILLRFWFWRWFRKIAIVAKNDEYSQIESDLKWSWIFKNITSILPWSLWSVKDHDLLVVHYESFSEEEIKEIISYKQAKAWMIFYHPNADTRIAPEMMKIIWNKQNTTVVNFRWRLLNDIVTTLITTSYEKR
jgi:hypothetical protein